jgi:hypothetical protein
MNNLLAIKLARHAAALAEMEHDKARRALLRATSEAHMAERNYEEAKRTLYELEDAK